MNRSRLEEIIREEVQALDEGWLEKTRDALRSKKKKGAPEGEEGTPKSKPVKYQDAEQQTGPFAGRIRKTLTSQERRADSCWRASVDRGYTDEAARARCGIPSAEEIAATIADQEGETPADSEAKPETEPEGESEPTSAQPTASKEDYDDFDDWLFSGED